MNAVSVHQKRVLAYEVNASRMRSAMMPPISAIPPIVKPG
jgi:hypothetical protein